MAGSTQRSPNQPVELTLALPPSLLGKQQLTHPPKAPTFMRRMSKGRYLVSDCRYVFGCLVLARFWGQVLQYDMSLQDLTLNFLLHILYSIASAWVPVVAA